MDIPFSLFGSYLHMYDCVIYFMWCRTTRKFISMDYCDEKKSWSSIYSNGLVTAFTNFSVLYVNAYISVVVEKHVYAHDTYKIAHE